jgi:hypothetical protein
MVFRVLGKVFDSGILGSKVSLVSTGMKKGQREWALAFCL